MNDPSPLNPPPPPPGGSPTEAVKTPALLLIIVGSLGAAGSLVCAVLSLLGVAVGGMGRPGGTDNGPEHMGQMVGQGIGLVFIGLSVVVAALVIWGGVKMKNLQSYGLSLTAAILAIVPCYWSCCILGIVPGIWAVVVLMRPEVKAAFAQRSGQR